MNVYIRNASLFFLFFVLSTCSLIRKNGISQHIKTEGKYKILSSEKDTSISLDSSLVIGYVLDEYSKSPVSYGYATLLNHNTKGILIDSSGNFKLRVIPGEYKLKISSFSNIDLITDTIVLNNGYKTKIKIFLGSNIMYDTDIK